MTVSRSDSEIDFESEDELGTIGAVKAKMQKLRDELAEVKKERTEYLDGWQRAKADLVNTKRESAHVSQRSSTMAREAFISELIPAIDSFDMAMAGDGWQKVDPAWRSGVESIRSQITAVLQSHGVETFGAVGEIFDPTQHESIQEIDAKGEPGTIAKVLRSGYRTGERVLRPAHVAVIAKVPHDT